MYSHSGISSWLTACNLSTMKSSKTTFSVSQLFKPRKSFTTFFLSLKCMLLHWLKNKHFYPYRYLGMKVRMGATSLDGARSKKQVWRHQFRT